MTMPDPEDDLDAFMAFVQEYVTAQFNEQAALILARIDEVDQREVADGEVVLIGTEGQIDEVWQVPDPLPEILRRAIPERPTMFVGDPTRPTLRTAEYRRVGWRTYVREPLQ